MVAAAAAAGLAAAGAPPATPPPSGLPAAASDGTGAVAAAAAGMDDAASMDAAMAHEYETPVTPGCKVGGRAGRWVCFRRGQLAIARHAGLLAVDRLPALH